MKRILLLTLCALLPACQVGPTARSNRDGSHWATTGGSLFYKAKSRTAAVQLPDGTRLENAIVGGDGTTVAISGIRTAGTTGVLGSLAGKGATIVNQ